VYSYFYHCCHSTLLNKSQNWCISLMKSKSILARAWDMSNERPRKVFSLTQEGKSALAFTENSLLMIAKK
jgi:hypothetical protein